MEEGEDDFLRDWASGSCLSKAVLDGLAGRKNGGIELYSRYMDSATLIDADLSFSGLSRYGLVGRRLMSDVQYKLADPYQEPAHWSVYSEADVNAAGQLAGARVVVYAYDCRGDPVPRVISRDFWLTKTLSAWASSRFWLWHDSRLDVSLSEDREDLSELAVFVVASGAGRHRLFRLPPEQAAALDARTHVWFGTTAGPAEEVCQRVDDFEGDFLALADSLLGVRPLPDSQPPAGRIASLDAFFASDRHQLYKRWSSAAPCVVLLSFTRVFGKSLVRRNRSKPQNLRFDCLAITSEFTPEQSRHDFADHAVPEALVVCFYAQRYACVLSDSFRDQAVRFHLDTRGLAQKLLNRSDLSGVRRVLPREQVAKAEEERKKKKPPKASDRVTKICKCRTCRSSKKYADNMSRAGPDRLCTVPYSLSEILEMLGAYDAGARQLINRMVRLSVASMDIESQTIGVDLVGPRPGPRVEYPAIGGPALEGHVIKTQRPIMIGHTDSLLRERGERWHDVVADDTPEAAFKMFSRYWLKVTALRREAVNQKKIISAELLQLSKKYQEACVSYARGWLEISTIEREHHYQACQRDIATRLFSGQLSSDQARAMAEQADWTYNSSDDWVMPEICDILNAFNNTVPGLLARKLDSLLGRYVVFNFYG